MPEPRNSKKWWQRTKDTLRTTVSSPFLAEKILLSLLTSSSLAGTLSLCWFAMGNWYGLTWAAATLIGFAIPGSILSTAVWIKVYQEVFPADSS
jgi:hypothetical protein